MPMFSVAIHTHYDDYYHQIVGANDWLSALTIVSPDAGSLFTESTCTMEQAMKIADDQEWWLSIIEIK